jgi:uncharacterized membrane protein
MENPLTWVGILGGVLVFLILALTASGRVAEDPDPAPCEYITPVAQAAGISPGCIAVLAILGIVAVFATKGILWG